MSSNITTGRFREEYRFTPGGMLVKWLLCLLIVGVVLHLIAIFSFWKEQELVESYLKEYERQENLEPGDVFELNEEGDLQVEATNDEVDRLDREADELYESQQRLFVYQLLLFIVTAVLFSVAIARANRNARAMGVLGMRHTPGWCVGWFFIPIANLFKPYQAVKEIWKASGSNTDNWEFNPSSPLVAWWWFFWIVTRVLNRLVIGISESAKTLEEFHSAANWKIFSSVADVVLTLLVGAMMYGLFRMQERKHDLAVAADQSSAVGGGMMCRSCGEQLTVMIGDCPMCGAALNTH